MGMNDTLIIEEHGYIDQLTIYNDPRESALRTLLKREYRRLGDKIEYKRALPGWLAFRRALQGSSSHGSVR